MLRFCTDFLFKYDGASPVKGKSIGFNLLFQNGCTNLFLSPGPQDCIKTKEKLQSEGTLVLKGMRHKGSLEPGPCLLYGGTRGGLGWGWGVHR